MLYSLNPVKARFLVRAGIGWCTVAGILLATPQGVNAMVVVKRDFPELVARAEQIVVGTVSKITHETDEVGAPWTAVTLSDLYVLKGDAGAVLTLRFYGGATGDVAVHIPDMPSFTVGERDVLFVAGTGRDICPLVGIFQGRFHVRFDRERRRDIVEASDGAPVLGRAGRELRRGSVGQDGAATPLTLDGFLELVASELAHPSGGAGVAR
ncbi:MAG: hypothetical protein ACE5I7_00725 [Candidatus Binatia bacterium]